MLKSSDASGLVEPRRPGMGGAILEDVGERGLNNSLASRIVAEAAH